MAVLRIPEEDRTITGKEAVTAYLGKIGIDYDVWEPSHPLGWTHLKKKFWMPILPRSAG